MMSYIMMTSSNRNIFHVTGHLCGEFTGHRRIPCTKASDTELWCFLWSVPEWTVEQTIVKLCDLRRQHAHYYVTIMHCAWISRQRDDQSQVLHPMWWRSCHTYLHWSFYGYQCLNYGLDDIIHNGSQNLTPHCMLLHHFPDNHTLSPSSRWNENVILMRFSSLAAQKVVI